MTFSSKPKTTSHASSQATFYSLTNEQVFASLNTSITGITDEEANVRIKINGPNQISQKKRISPLSIFLSQFKNTLTLILIASAILILFIYFFGEHEQSDLIEACLILGIVIIIAVLGFIQEYKAEKSIESLKKLLAFKARVKRNGTVKEIDVQSLVPGDIVILEEGVKVPADIRLLEVYNLSVIEASLTGESTPVSKNAAVIEHEIEIADQKNMVFSGTNISSGKAVGVVVKTGDKTEIGKIAGMVAETEDETTPIQKRLDDIGRILGYVIVVICLIVFVFIMFFAHDFADETVMQRLIHSFIASVALAVAAIPEGLPAVVTITLALGTQRMLKKNALVRKLNSIETLGSTDIICSDKTGTLTKGEMTVRSVYFNNSMYSVSGTGYESQGEFTKENTPIDSSLLTPVLKAGLLCNNAAVKHNGTILGDPTEAALIVAAMKAKLKTIPERVIEIPFSSERKMMSVVVKEDDTYTLFCKGAPETILSKSVEIWHDKQKKLDDTDKKLISEATREMSENALRVLGFAYKKIDQKTFEAYKSNPEKFEENLIFLGLQGMIDPPRLEVKNLITECQKSAIRILMITGDHIDTARAIAHEIGIEGDSITGEEIEKKSDEELQKLVETTSIYARVNPGTKMRIVHALQSNKHIVAMTGDGVNDAPALKRADIGIAMGITGTDVAKEASDMVLLDDKFSSIVAAVKEGRGIFHNIRKFVHYLLSCNIAEVLVVFAAVIFYHEIPLTATMLLWINIVTDGIPAVALGVDRTEKNIMRHPPKAFQTNILTRRIWTEMVLFGIILTIGVMGIYHLNMKEGVLEAKGAAFTAIVVFELVYIFIIRSSYNVPFFSNRYLILAVIGSFLLQLAILYIPLLSLLFEVRHIDMKDWIYIFIGSIILWIFFAIVKRALDRIIPESN